jgi:hypothetical protein
MKSETLIDPLEKSPIGDTPWMMSVSGWTKQKIWRLAREGIIKGAFQAQAGIQGSAWNFRKEKTLRWLRSLENK